MPDTARPEGEDLGDRVDLYRLWDTEYTEMIER